MALDEDVLEMVRSQLERDPPPSTTALYGRAVRINSDIYDLSLRQFHAKYPLRVKREKARREGGGASRSDGGGEDTGGPGDGGIGDAGDAVPDDAGRRHLFGDRAGSPEGPGATGGTRRSGRAVAAAGTGTTPVDDAETRERVRRVFWRLARDVAEAEGPEKLVGIVEGMPDRVDEIARIVARRPPGS